jgi:hypothetical protein
MLAVLGVACLAELLATVVRLARGGQPRGRVLARLAFSLLPLVAFGLGHVLANPWRADLSGPIQGVLRAS